MAEPSSPPPQALERTLFLSMGKDENKISTHVKWTNKDIESLLVLYEIGFDHVDKKCLLIDDINKESLEIDGVTEKQFRIMTIFGLSGTETVGLSVVASGRFPYSFQPEVDPQTVELNTTSEVSLFGEIVPFCLTETEPEVRTCFSPPDRYSVKLVTPYAGDLDILVILEGEDTKYVFRGTLTEDGWGIPVSLLHRKTYKCCIINLNTVPDVDNVFMCQALKDVSELRTVMTKEDVLRLQAKAERYVRDKRETPTTHKVTVMFRNKPTSYMTTIMDKNDGLMKKYEKDKGADPHCPINNTIHGLFFSVSLRPNGTEFQLPNFSFYGSRRLHVPVEALFDGNTNLYFADFFCTHRPRRGRFAKPAPHYVTLVMTKPGSIEDTFCRATIPHLDPFDNIFFYKTRGADVEYCTTTSLHVEVLYTEDVNIQALQTRYSEEKVHFSDVILRGRGQSYKDGLPKYISCSQCNL